MVLLLIIATATAGVLFSIRVLIGLRTDLKGQSTIEVVEIGRKSIDANNRSTGSSSTNWQFRA